MIVAKGRFEGRGGHRLSGAFVIELHGAEHWLVTSENFYFDGSPEPAFAFTSDLLPTAAQAQATRFLNLPGSGSLVGAQIEVSGKLEGRTGPDFDLATVKTIFLWCFQTPFLLGIGPITRMEAEI